MGTVSPVLDSTWSICTWRVFHCRPMGLPVRTARPAAVIRPSGTWPEAAMPSRVLRIMYWMSLPTGQTMEQRAHMVQES